MVPSGWGLANRRAGKADQLVGSAAFSPRHLVHQTKAWSHRRATRTGYAAFELIAPFQNEPHEGAKVKYKGSMLRRGILAGAMVLAGCGAAVAVAAAPAGASNTEMTAAGSFTTFFMMHALFPEVNNINPNPESGT